MTITNVKQTSIPRDGAAKSIASDPRELRKQVIDVVLAAPIVDLHTHLFPPQFGDLSLWGIDELLTYHYLIAELFRFSDTKPADFWQLEKCAQANLIWRKLFVENTPLSEATKGVVRVLSALGLDTRAADLSEAREFFAAQDPNDYLDRVLSIAGVSDVVMTNDPIDEAEVAIWNGPEEIDPRFHAALRLDRILNGWVDAVPLLNKQGYVVSNELNERSIVETRRFLDDWIVKMKPLYLGASLPADFVFPDDTPRGALLREAILPKCREHKLPLALMIGVRRRVNPELKLAGDGVGAADVSSLVRICSENPDVKFLSTFLSRENQHELCVAARKFSNLMPFGCWWFLNNPSIIDEITRERLELLGTSFVPQHSDARILDQLIYKWDHSRRVIADVLADSYSDLLRDGRQVTRGEIERDVAKLFSENFRNWVSHE